MNKVIKLPKKKDTNLKKTRQRKDKHSDILTVVHGTAQSLYDSGLMNIATMHTFDAMCLPSVRDLTPREIKQIRLKEKLSQPVFAEYLNASASTIKKWETGEKHPTGPALKLLNLVANKGLSILT